MAEADQIAIEALNNEGNDVAGQEDILEKKQQATEKHQISVSRQAIQITHDFRQCRFQMLPGCKAEFMLYFFRTIIC